MYRITESQTNDILESLINSTTVTSTIDKTDERFAEIQTFQNRFNQIHNTPDVIRFCMQLEHNFIGVVDGFEKPEREAKELLSYDWYDSTFVIVDYSDVRTWLEKCIEEADKGKTVVALIPARTNTHWFHELVLQQANELKFIKGRVRMANRKKAGAFADAVCVFRRVPNKIRREQATKGEPPAVAMLTCSVNIADPKPPEFSATMEEN